MNLMPRFDLPDPTNMLMHAHKQLSHRRAHFLSNPCYGAVGAGVSPSIYWAEVWEIPWTSCEDMRGLTEINRHILMSEPFYFFLLLSLLLRNLMQLCSYCIVRRNTGSPC